MKAFSARLVVPGILVAALSASAGCGDSVGSPGFTDPVDGAADDSASTNDGAHLDAASDTGVDATVDGTVSDAGTDTADGGHDASSDAGADGTVIDSGTDAAPDANDDASDDAALDSAPDAPVDAAPDAPLTCNVDNAKGPGETGVDCGGSVCPKCPLTQGCSGDNDCLSGVCENFVCVECRTIAQCPAPTGECQTAACTGHSCVLDNVPVDTATVAGQTPGDCQLVVCNGSGGTTTKNEDPDKPDDGDPCTTDICTTGVPSHGSAAAGITCSSNSGSLCDGSGACVDVPFMVVRVGDGATALTSAAAAVTLEERRLNGSLLRSIAMPIAVDGNNQALTLGGTGTSEGNLARSADEHTVSLAGYNTAPGTLTVATSSTATVTRVVGRVDISGTVDTSSQLTAFTGHAVRSAVSADGSGFWVSGDSGSASSGGFQFVALGASTSTRIIGTPASLGNLRFGQIFGGQLYGTSGSSGFTNVFTVGNGEPQVGAQTATPLPGMLTTGANPYGFVLFDRNPGVAGLDTLYVSDDNALSNGTSAGGVHRWTFDGTTWSDGGVLNTGITSGIRGLAGQTVGSVVVLIAVTAENPSRVVTFVDNGNGSPAATGVATSASNFFYRGVALSPH